jgi:uncharacterized membrane protein
MKISVKQLISLALIAAAFAFTAAVYDRLPERIPTHWNWKGEVDGWMPRTWGVFVIPLITTIIWGVFLVLPRISPKEFPITPFIAAYEWMSVGLVAFMVYMNALVLLVGLGYPVPMTPAVLAGMGGLFILIGGVLGKTTRNCFVGIRTAWTFANDEVWERTHRLGGKVFMAAGAATIVAGLLPNGMWLILVALAAAVLIPVVYSYYLYRNLGLNEPAPGRKSRR